MNQQNLIKTIVQAIRQSEPKTKAYDTQARVTRIDGSTAWVHIPGGVAETPVKLTIAAKAGDTVQVRVSGGRAFLVGNSSAPPTDDRVAKEAVKQVGVVKKTLTVVKEVAEKAQRIAGNTNQYFWHTQEGTDTGAHITEIPQEEFLADPASGGGNLLARSNGIAVRDGLTELATFGASGSTIGETDKTHLEMDFRSIKAKDKEGNEYFHVGDLRNADGIAETRDLFDADGTQNAFTLSYPAVEILHVYVMGDETSNYTFNGSRVVTVSTSVAESGDPVEIFYTTETIMAKAYTLGIRASDSTRDGFMSAVIGRNNKATMDYAVAIGYNNWADGYEALALGNDCKVTGHQSLAGGLHSIVEGNRSLAYGYSAYAAGHNSAAFGYGTQAYNNYEAVFGRYNETLSGLLFSVGNGTGENARSNAFAVTNNGVLIAGGVKQYTPTWTSGHAPADYHCVVSAGICSFSYRGPTIAHSAGTQIGTLPVGARPKSVVYCPCVKMVGGVVGCIRIMTTGVFEVIQITDTSSTGRLYFNCSFPVV